MLYDAKERNFLVDEFITPTEVAQAVVNRVVPQSVFEISDAIYVLDPGANTGVWGQAVHHKWPYAVVTGVELMQMPGMIAGYDIYFDNTDFLEWKTRIKYDLIIGNPPYSDYRSGTRKTVADQWVAKSLDLLRPGGCLIFLLRAGFTHSVGRYNNLYKEQPFKEIHYLLPRPNFYDEDDRVEGDGARYEYSIFVWQKGWIGTPTSHWLIWR